MNILTSDLMDRIGAGLTRARLRSVQEQVWAAKPLDVRFQLIKKIAIGAISGYRPAAKIS
jgi:hypothetical protein